MAPPTIAPPIRPAAMPAPTPSPALAGGVGAPSDPATVPTVGAATKVFFMLLALLEMGAFEKRLGSKAHAHSVGIGRPARKRANGQSTVNACGAVTRKSGLFRAFS